MKWKWLNKKWKWLKEEAKLLKRLTLFELVVGVTGILGFILAVFSESRAHGYSEQTRLARDFAIVSFLTISLAIVYGKLQRARNTASKYSWLSNMITKSSHDITHKYRDIICKLYAVADKYQQSMDDFAFTLEDTLKKRFTDDKYTNRLEALLDVLDGEKDKHDVINEFTDLDGHVDHVISKRDSEHEKLRNEVLSLTKELFEKILLICKKQFQYCLLINGYEDEEVTITIKQLMQPTQRGATETGKLDDLEVFTCFRDPDAYINNKERGVGAVYHVGKNTAFRQCFLGRTQSHWTFLKNDLKKQHDEGSYENERADFARYYNSALVVPIQDDKGIRATIYGFLAVDCPNKNGEDVFTLDPHFHLLANVADKIASYWRTVDTYFPDLFSDYYDIKFQVK